MSMYQYRDCPEHPSREIDMRQARHYRDRDRENNAVSVTKLIAAALRTCPLCKHEMPTGRLADHVLWGHQQDPDVVFAIHEVDAPTFPEDEAWVRRRMVEELIAAGEVMA